MAKEIYPITQVEGAPVLVCNGLHYAIDLTGAVWTFTKPTSGSQYTASVQIGSWKLTATYTKTKSGNTTTYTNVSYSESVINDSQE